MRLELIFTVQPGSQSQPRLARTRAMRARAQLRAKALGESAFGALVRGRSDRQLERTLGSRAGMALIFKGMERAFMSERADGFEGEVQYLLTMSNGTATHEWYLAIRGDNARARRGRSTDPAVTFTTSLPTFARIAAGEAHPAKEMLQGRFLVEGDFGLALRLGEMFGGDALV